MNQPLYLYRPSLHRNPWVLPGVFILQLGTCLASQGERHTTLKIHPKPRSPHTIKYSFSPSPRNHQTCEAEKQYRGLAFMKKTE